MISKNYKTWTTVLDAKTCKECRSQYGKIYTYNELIHPKPPLHPNCRCIIEYLKSLIAGTATKNGKDGADWWLYYLGKLPDYYISAQQAKNLGWKSKLGNLYEVLPGKMIAGGIYNNKNGHHPSTEGRVW